MPLGLLGFHGQGHILSHDRAAGTHLHGLGDAVGSHRDDDIHEVVDFVQFLLVDPVAGPRVPLEGREHLLGGVVDMDKEVAENLTVVLQRFQQSSNVAASLVAFQILVVVRIPGMEFGAVAGCIPDVHKHARLRLPAQSRHALQTREDVLRVITTSSCNAMSSCVRTE